MSSNSLSSYEGFRRKNSLNSFEGRKGSCSPDLSTLKFNQSSHFSEVENLSMQLESFTKKSLTSRSLKDKELSSSFTSQSNTEAEDPKTENKSVNIFPRKEINNKRKEIEVKAMVEVEPVIEKKQKMRSSAIFNKFEVIQEENIDIVEPVALKTNFSSRVNEKKPLPFKNIAPKAPQPIRKTLPGSIKPETAPRKQRIKQDLTDIEKMHAEFELKRGTRDQMNAKPPLNSNIPKRTKESTPRETARVPKPSHATVQSRLNEQISRAGKNPMKSSLVLETKMHQSECSIMQEMASSVPVEKTEMIAMRMVSEKQKAGLIFSILNLQNIIQKNQICSDNLQQIMSSIRHIEKLLTQ